ncbi:MAG: SPOR domain-containing protein [Desulfobacterales bacterium]|nr:SPOR domain-containing protein [Desulfobacterales bacterium]
MTWFLRHISVRLWLTALFSMPASFFIVFQLNNISVDMNPVILFLSIALFVYTGCGFILDLIGKKLISNLIKEGAAWERAGIYKRGEEKYYKALRIYDSFLISPFSAKTCAEKLSGAMAKFMAVSEISDITFEKASTLFLKLSPNDEHMALLWLKKLFHIKDLDLNATDHDILTLIAENHYNNNKILPLLTNAFIQLERTDFTAQKVYKKALTHLKQESKKRIMIQKLIRKQEEGKEIPSKLSFADSSPLKRQASNTKPSISNFLKKISTYLFGLINLILSAFNNFFLSIIRHEKTKIYIKFSLIFLSLFLIIGLLFNTFSNFSKNRTKPVESKLTIAKAPVPKMPYTIQIAAFLSQPHAENYTKKLKETGLDARLVKVEGKSKTWFLVRISKFEDKISAAEYGDKLKREGLIKDFFVANK